MPDEPIAIIGASCRLPGAPDPAAFWRLLRDGRSAVATAPAERGLGDLAGAFLDGVDQFDADFFDIPPRRADAMDPQQRLMLELAWEALEDAGVLPASLHGRRTAGFVGAMWDDYALLSLRQGSDVIGRYTMTGVHRGLIANSVSHALGVRGPSLTVDTGQSSSLVAVHLACESLRRGESGLALAGGVNLNLSRERADSAARFGGLSPSGRCFTFDERADGYVPGEGGAMVVLKPLAAALSDGDPVLCAIRGSAMTSGSGDDGMTVPSADAQREVVRLACERAGVDPLTVQYVELHGTGTRVGDPVEAEALGRALETRRRCDAPLRVGSVKTNLGHLEGAAGITGLLKAALSIHHRRIPASLNFQAMHPRVSAVAPNLRVQTELGSWPHPQLPLFAGVSSFGMGGANCHVVLADAFVPRAKPVPEPPAVAPTLVSGRSASALRAQAASLAARLRDEPSLRATDVAYASVTARTSFEHRAVVVGSGRDALLDGLDAIAEGGPAPGVVTGVVGPPGRTVFVFPGHGSQWAGMGLQLMETSECFAASVRECDEALSHHLDWSVVDVLRGVPGTPPFERPDVVQPVIFAVTVSLARVWQSYGVHPDAVVGHSMGEIAAAYIAGGLSLADAARVIAIRGKAVLDVAGWGAMASIPLPADQVRSDLAVYQGSLEVAGYNSPHSTAVSGDAEPLAALLRCYQQRGIPARRIAIDYASHSQHIDKVRQLMLDIGDDLAPRPSGAAFHSTVTGGLLSTAELDADYWYSNLRRPVQLTAVITGLLDAGYRTFVECGAHPVLTSSIQETLSDRRVDSACVVGTIRRNEGGMRRLLTSVAQVHSHGTAVDWRSVFAGTGTNKVKLPTYSYQRQRYWLGEHHTRPRVETKGLVARLDGRPGAEQRRTILEFVKANAAAVLGHGSSSAVPAERSFRESGFDSLMAVEFRAALERASDLRLPSTLVFDHPTPTAVAGYLHDRLVAPPEPLPDDLEPATDEELFRVLDEQLGTGRVSHES